MSDPKLITARRKYGAAAIVVYLQLLVMAYRDKGYYLSYRDAERDGVIWAIKSEVLSGRYEPDAEKIAEMINCLAACGLFDGDLFRQGIITSHRMQEHYYFATAARTNPEVRWELWLLTEDEMREISSRSVLLQKFISREENHSFSPEKPTFSACESTHSKEIHMTGHDTTSSLVESDVESILGEKLTRPNRSSIAKMRSLGMSDAVILDTAQYTMSHAQSDSRGYMPYFMTVLRERMKNGVLTADDLAKQQEQRPKKKQAKPEPAPSIGPAPSQLSDWEIAWREQVMERRKQRMQEENQHEGNSDLDAPERAF